MQAEIVTPLDIQREPSEQNMKLETEDDVNVAAATANIGGKKTQQPVQNYAEDLTLNSLYPDGDIDKNKARRYWTAREEEKFLEIWGRDNWRLTRHGKNTVHFAKWSEELKEVHNIDIKPEEIQAKVNQTRAKFRQVKKTMQAEGGAARWKKYYVIDRILKNQYRSDDAEPIPKEALENNRDVTPPPNSIVDSVATTKDEPCDSALTAQPAVLVPTSVITTQASTVLETASQQPLLQSQQQPPTLSMDNSVSSEHNTNSDYFNASNNSDAQARLGYNSDAYNEQYELKHEYDENSYQRAQPAAYQEPQNYGSPVEEPQLHQLQTPQQQQQQQQQQQEYHSQYQNASTQPQNLSYEHDNNTYVDTAHHTTLNDYNSAPTTATVVANNIVDYTNHTNGTVLVPTPRTPISNVIMPTTTTIATPATALTTTATHSRKRGRPVGSTANIDQLEAIYVEEVRRKNQILEDQAQISRRRVEIEQRKLDLMLQFLPKYIEQQAEILAKLSRK